MTKAFGDKLLFENLNFRLPPGGIVGIIGPNGAGKTTLFRMITGQEKPDVRHLHRRRHREAGLCRPEPRRARRRQDRLARTSPTARTRSTSARRKINSRAYCRPVQLHAAPTSRRRSACSPAANATASTWPRCSRRRANVLLLDEPTNDLDVETLRALEEALDDFAGCAVVISHDRWFLDRIATHILAFEGDSQVVWFEGNYQDYEADRHRRLGTDADQPHRIKYKPLVR